MSWLECSGSVTGLMAVALVVRQHLANWPLGMVSSTLWFCMARRRNVSPLSLLKSIA